LIKRTRPYRTGSDVQKKGGEGLVKRNGKAEILRKEKTKAARKRCGLIDKQGTRQEESTSLSEADEGGGEKVTRRVGKRPKHTGKDETKGKSRAGGGIGGNKMSGGERGMGTQRRKWGLWRTKIKTEAA